MITKQQARVWGQGTIQALDRQRQKHRQTVITVTHPATVDPRIVVNTVRRGCGGTGLIVEPADLDQPALTPENIRLHVEAQTAHLREIIRKLQEENEALVRQQHMDMERTVTAKEAAQIAGVSLPTACRYLDDGWWTGHKRNGRWVVPLDQSFRRKRGAK